jgi:nucleotide-binding universal stress UspA family protein
MSGIVLAAIDLAHPEHHDAILSRAAQMAQLDDAQIAVVTVIPDFGMSIVGTFFQEGAEQQALTGAAEALHGATKAVLGAEASAAIKHITRHGTAYEQILDAARSLDTRLIVLGAHRPDLKDYLLGPNAARVVRHSDCSVLVVRD